MLYSLIITFIERRQRVLEELFENVQMESDSYDQWLLQKLERRQNGRQLYLHRDYGPKIDRC